jgi:hypothetical protein
MLDLLIVVYIECMIMLIELQKVVNQELKHCVVRLPQPYQNEPYQKLWMVFSYIFIALEIIKM